MQIAVASGKGGTGKTTIATNLALSLAPEGPLQFLDCDVEEPNAHLFLHPTLGEEEAVNMPVPVVDEGKCTACGRCAEVCAFNAIAVLAGHVLTFSELCHGCGGCVRLCPEKALEEEAKEIGIIQRGNRGNIAFVHGKLKIGSALAPPIVEAVREQARRDGLVIIDASPGTSCPVVAAVKDVDYCLLVTEPTPFGLHDLDLAVQMLAKLGLPAGVILNRAGEGDEMIEEYCREKGLPLHLKIPFDRRYAALYARGSSLVQEYPHWRGAFRDLMEDIEGRVGK
ncbi:MAG: P-loop NTPase [Firmicutes bacterium]|nr:P-loop NTPase [Bacillota bacterium]NLJ33502.1 P-loop NTPase [Bacillota bacterium]